MRRLLATATVGLLTAAGLATGTISPAAAADRTEPTRFALWNAGLGTLAKGGEVPASSGRTAFRTIACTNRAGLDRSNHIAEATVPGLGVLSGLRTRVWTAKTDGVVSSNSVHTLTKIVIKESGVGKVAINGIRSASRAWHDAKGFHASWETEIGSIVYTPVDGAPDVKVIPNPGRTLEIPNLARIKLGSHHRRTTEAGSRASVSALKVEVIPSGTTARVAHTRAKISTGIKSGLFRGNSNATRLAALDGNLTSGPNPFLPMPCQGTDGEVVSNDLAELNLGGQIVVGGLNTEQRAEQTRRKAWGYEKSSVAELNLGDGQLVITGVVARANVTRRGGTVNRDAVGTTVGSITSDGNPHEIPDPGTPLTIDGVAQIQTRLVEKWRTGIKVTSVRITLLDGTGTVINLGQAQLRIMPSGL